MGVRMRSFLVFMGMLKKDIAKSRAGCAFGQGPRHMVPHLNALSELKLWKQSQSCVLGVIHLGTWPKFTYFLASDWHRKGIFPKICKLDDLQVIAHFASSR